MVRKLLCAITTPGPWGGCYSRTLHGPRKAVVPPGWDWPAAVVGALLEYVGYAFEKSDSQERWGSENVFAAMTGGRSLRFTGESVYSTSCQQGDMGDEPEENQLPKLAASDCEEPTDMRPSTGLVGGMGRIPR